MLVLMRAALFLSFVCVSFTSAASPPTSFSQAKVLSKRHVYFDQNQNGALGEVHCSVESWLRSGCFDMPAVCQNTNVVTIRHVDDGLRCQFMVTELR